MATFIDENEVRIIEELAIDAELLIEKDDARKDLKEKRGIKKQTFFVGSHKARR